MSVPDKNAKFLKFDYLNWENHEHNYVIQVEKLEWTQYPVTGESHWMIHGFLSSRDGDARIDLDNRRRSFRLEGMRNVKEITGGEAVDLVLGKLANGT